MKYIEVNILKRCLTTLLVSILFLFATSVVAYFAQYIPLGFWGMFGIASGVLFLGFVMVLLTRRYNFVKLIIVALNSVAMGFYLRSWYINRGFNNSLWLMLAVSLLASVYFVVFLLPLLIPALNRRYGWYLLAFTLLSIVGYVLLVVLTKTTWVSTLGYYGILQLGFIISLSFKCDSREELYNSFLASSYSVAVCAIIILIIVVSDGNALEGLDFLSGGFDSGVSSPLDKKNKTQSNDLPKIIM
ncbi:MAG: hypothetical protein J1F66_00985 [Clostridiales bacterium]|nr:hypothetical protein [Clostridiales bacterium]